MTQKTNTRESGFEEFIENELANLHGYRSRLASHYEKNICMDTELVVEFIQKSQPKAWEALVAQYDDHVEDRFFARLNEEIVARGIISVLREGITDRGVRIILMYPKPETDLNPETVSDYENNILSVTRQLKYSVKNENSIDLVVFINGLPIFTFELKNQFTGQNVINAIKQYKADRDPKELLLAFKRCVTHFAVDTDQVYMTTKLAGMKTYFLPFNKGDNGASGNPVIEGKYKTAYLWEDVLSKDSVVDLLSNFVQDRNEKIVDERGRGKTVGQLIFPRYHQMDTVRRLIQDAQEHGPGKTYLIQHSAGSGKSNTIAWAAHRLAGLHSKNNEHVFDSVIVITDRRVLDAQLSNTVDSFSQVTGLVKHVESSKELREALESGVKIITSTLQKFPVITEAIETIAGKKFAVIIDEAHSSWSGESAADLREVLTTNDLDEAAKRDEKVFETTEDIIVKRMKARKIHSPNISFLAFTATPKQKTLELFGTEDPLSGKYIPFALYSMKQAIEERFILDVLKNYTTYQTYFGLLKKSIDDPEFNKKEAQRLMIGYVEKHDHAIDTKVKIMVEHFEEKIASEIDGKAKAMIVTKSRLHAVRYKLALDKYLLEKGYPHKALVAFSGTVKDGALEYTETGMNHVPEKQTAEEFKKDEYKFLVVAEKFQTGFDQPLLSVMYVDKKLSSVSAVQTLSRLNRTMSGKENVFVLDFVNNTDEIKDAFQPYYTTTILSEATNPNILHDLERDILYYKVFTDFEVSGFVEEYFHGGAPSVLNAIIDKVVERIVDEKTSEEIEQFKSLVGDYLRKYAFISQIVTFQDPQLEKLYYFLKFLNRKLPKRENPLPLEVLEAIDMETYKVEKKEETAIRLENEDGLIDPMQSSVDPQQIMEDEKDALSRIIKEVNERFGTNFSDPDRLILNDLGRRMLDNDTLQGSVENNSPETVRLKFNELFQGELVDMLDRHFSLYQKLDQSPELKKYVQERMFEHIVRQMGKKS